MHYLTKKLTKKQTKKQTKKKLTASKLTLLLCFVISLLTLSGFTFAAEDLGMSALKLTTNPDGSQEYSITLQILIFMTALSFIPAAVIMMTSFTRIIVIMAILRQAMGLQQSPSNQVIVGLTLFMTLFIMTPVYNEINARAIQPYLQEQLTSIEAIDKAKVPLRAFMLEQTRIKDLDTLASMAGIEAVEQPTDLPMTVIIPAFVISELKTAFQIGFMLFIPFLIIDLVVASILMAMGMMMLSPMIVSLPFKLMLFVLIDGWNLVIGTIATSYGMGSWLMGPEVFIDILSDALFLVILLVSAIIVPGLCMGLIVAVFQAATSINEQTLSFLPRLIVTLLALIFGGHWLLQKIMDFTIRLISSIPSVVS